MFQGWRLEGDLKQLSEEEKLVLQGILMRAEYILKMLGLKARAEITDNYASIRWEA